MSVYKLREKLFHGLVIPAHPLALTSARTLDERRQRALTRYYLDSGVGGLAVGVHTTQFEIHDPNYGLFRPVLELAMDEMKDWDVVKIAGVVGHTPNAGREAAFARGLGYDAVLVSPGAFYDDSEDDLLDHMRVIAEIIPVFGFYLQPSVGGRVLSYSFWRRFAEIDNVVAVKIAPFNRYQTLDVVRGILDAGRARDIALYTGNDDTILTDLLTEFQFGRGESISIVGGLLGHWAVWTHRVVLLMKEIQALRSTRSPIPPQMLTLAAQITDANAALFDPQHKFHGCIPGIHEILRRQGLLLGRWCLNPHEELSPGQMDEIDRVCRAYPHLTDDDFVRANLDKWLR